MRRHLLPLGGVLLLALAAMGPLLLPGYPVTHDGHHQVIRLMHFHRALADGQFPPRWAGNALCGYGYPLFVFTYRLPFWLAEAWYLASDSLTGAVKATFVLTFLGSGAAMYWFGHRLTGVRLAAATGAILYLWAPYRFLDVYVRGALGEAVTFTFVPLLYGGLLALARDPRRRPAWTIGVALIAAALLLSHVMIAALLVVPVAVWWTYLCATADGRRGFAIASAQAGAIAVLLTAYYWLPASVERGYTIFTTRLGDYYADHFLDPWQLLRSPWGFGFDGPGAAFDRMSFELGDAQWLAVVAATAWVVRRRSALGAVFLGTVAAGVYGMLPQAGWFYEALGRAVVVDLPWKWLSVCVFAIATLAALAVAALDPRRRRLAATLLVALALWSNRDHVRVGARDDAPDVAYWTSDSTSNDYAEYTPAGFDPACAAGDPDFATITGDGDADLVARESNAIGFVAHVRSERATIAVKLADYPGWEAWVDGAPAPQARDRGKLTVSVPRGHHPVALRFTETGARRMGDRISLLTVLGLVAAIVYRGLRRPAR